MPRALFFLLLLLLLSLGHSTLSAVPPELGADDDGATARALLAQLEEHIPPQALPGVSCQELYPETLPGFAQLPPQPRALARAALALALSGAACAPQAQAEVLVLVRELGPSKAAALLHGLARLRDAPAPEPLPFLLLSLVRLGGSAPARPCSPPLRLQGPAAGTHPTAPGVGPLAKGGRAGAWLPMCRHGARHRSRREDEDPCHPPGEREAHMVLEWVPTVGTFYNLGTSIYYAFQGCEAVASRRALELAEDLGYSGLTTLAVSAGGPAAIVLQPALKAGVRALINYFTLAGTPQPVPTAHTGPVLIV
ncbi:APOF protein, partial [Atlantisia rogersi]|nr:APOF protein [Atlantisia rogersi]